MSETVASRAGIRFRRWIQEADGFVRLHFVFFTCLWPLLGAASVHRDAHVADLLKLLLAVATFHVYTFVLNDLIDLPIDRTQPSRRNDPLVRGIIRPWQAAVVVAVQPVLAVPLTMWLGGGWEAYASLAAAYLLMGAYNLWGKRFAWPPVTDVVQGLGWGSLALYAAYALAGEPGPLTWIVVAYATMYTLFMNGIHGGLRDLSNDLACGARTTAIWLGARPTPNDGDPVVPPAVGVFATTVLAGLIALSLLPVLRNDFEYPVITQAVVAALVAVLDLSALALTPKVVRPRRGEWDQAFRLQMYLILMSLPVAFFPYASGANLFLLIALKATSLLLFETTAVITQWLWLAIRSTARRALRFPLETRTVRSDG